MGATESLFTFEDERIKRDFYNSITRVLNIELANQNKTLQAADKQLKHIAILENLSDLDEYPSGLLEAIELRRKYPELSLVELSMKSEEVYHKPISKSGLNHRFRELERLANEAMEAYHAKSDRH
jgi:DNA-binding protein WhiA